MLSRPQTRSLVNKNFKNQFSSLILRFFNENFGFRWGPLLHAALMDLPHKVHRCLVSEEDPMIARFQARVALAIAAHFGLLDLASKLASYLRAL